MGGFSDRGWPLAWGGETRVGCLGCAANRRCATTGHVVEGIWVRTNLDEEEQDLQTIPYDESDVLRKEGEQEVTVSKSMEGGEVVKDMTYYDALDIPSSADEATIRRQYYLMAKQFHSDRNANDEGATESFKGVTDAHQVLSDPALRKCYDRDGLCQEVASVAAKRGSTGGTELSLVVAFLFGSGKFHSYVGLMGRATTDPVDPSNRLPIRTAVWVRPLPHITVRKARTLQRRRVVRLALALRTKIAPWVVVTGSTEQAATIEAGWEKEAVELCTATYGHQPVTTIGTLYNLLAILYQGSINSGQGLPTRRWAKRQKALLHAKWISGTSKLECIKSMLVVDEQLFQREFDKSEKQQKKQSPQIEHEAVSAWVRLLWATAVVDMVATIHEVVYMVLYDHSVDQATRLARSDALQALGGVWRSRPAVRGSRPTQTNAAKMYEGAAFAALFATLRRQDAVDV